MRALLFLIFFLSILKTDAQSIFEKVDQFLSEYVEDGRVDYAGIKRKPQQLNALVRDIAELDLSNRRVTPEFLKAFYINAYNILVIKQVVDRYPIYGPLKVEGFFNQIKHKVMGEEMTLDELEKGTLYKQFPDPRLHFVLVCAAKGCPPLVGYSYKPEELEQQLTDRTKEVLNLDWFIRVTNNEVKLSQIFEWYKGDFTTSKRDVIAYINMYRDVKIDGNKLLGYYEYDWSLNDLK